jgi:hypothetical protein
MKVVPIRSFVCRETVAVLQHLMARAQAGDLRGLALTARTPDGHEEIVFTGIYSSNPAKAVNATMRMSWRLTQLQDDKDAGRSG